MSKPTPRGRHLKSQKESSVKNFAIKVSLITAAFCLAVCGGLVYLDSIQPKPAPVSSPVIDWNVPASSGTPAPLPEKTFDKASADTYAPPKEPVSVSLKPSTLNIPSAGITAPVVAGGSANGSMVLPESSKVAQYTEASPITATEGSTVIAGHVNFADGSIGALGTLHKVSKGAPVYATDAAGNTYKYKVTKLDVLDKQALPYDIFRTEGPRQLVIVTCGGSIEIVNGNPAYTHNLVVTAEPAS